MLKERIKEDLRECWEELGYEYNEDYFVEVPKNTSFGDFSTNAALINARKNGLKSKEMAQTIAEMLSRKRHYKSVTVAGNGFINFVLTDSQYHKSLRHIREQGKKYGKSDYGEGKKILIEFVSANPTGPLNVVNARAAAFGDILYNIMNYAGYQAKREYYINDAGNQVDVLAESLEIRYREILGEQIEELPPGTYQGEYVKELALKLKAKEGSKIIHYSEADKLEKMKEFALEEIHQMQISSLEKFGVEFDSWVSEKMLRSQGVIEEVLSYLSEANCTYESEEAVWFASSKFGDEKDRVLMKSDGEITYFVPDLAYHLTKFHRGFDLMIDVLGPDHHGYVPRLMAAMRAIKYDESKIEIIFLQQVNLFEGGEKVKMSKRTGNIITMDVLIDEVGIDAARFFFLEKKPTAHLNFDLELAKKKTSENPVYYCQYAHARICSILKKAKKEKISLKDFTKDDLKRLKKEEELIIIKKLQDLPELIIAISDTREPHRLAFYTYDIASLFHKYYQKYQIVNSLHPELSRARLYLLTAVKDVLAICFDLMGISAPESMTKKKQKSKTKKDQTKKLTEINQNTVDEPQVKLDRTKRNVKNENFSLDMQTAKDLKLTEKQDKNTETTKKLTTKKKASSTDNSAKDSAKTTKKASSKQTLKNELDKRPAKVEASETKEAKRVKKSPKPSNKEIKDGTGKKAAVRQKKVSETKKKEK